MAETEAEQSYIQKQLGQYQDVLGPFPERRRPRLTLGRPVMEDVRGETIAQDVKGKYLGQGTYENRGKFNTKQTILLTQDVADALNNLHGEKFRQAQQQIASLQPDFSLGLAGIVDGQLQYYTNINQYYPDGWARISVANDEFRTPDFPSVSLPGSTESQLLNGQGYAIGLPFCKNPENKTGYLRPGSITFTNLFRKFRKGKTPANESNLVHLFCQGALYGLGPVYPRGLQIGTEQQENGSIRFTLLRQNLADLVTDGLLRKIDTYYKTRLQSGDLKYALGPYGAANLIMKQAEHMQSLDPNQPNVAEAIRSKWSQTGRAGNVAAWQEGYKTPEQRRYLMAFPPRDQKTGQPIPIQQRAMPNAGVCGAWGSVSGVTEQASQGGQLGARFTRTTRELKSKAKNNPGEVNGPSAITCGPTKGYTQNPFRAKNQAGGSRAAGPSGLPEILTRDGIPWTLQDQASDYLNWRKNPEQYGTNPYFFTQSKDGPQFSLAGPKYYAEQLSRISPEQAQAFEDMDLTQQYKIQQSNDAIRNLQTQMPALSKANGQGQRGGRGARGQMRQ
jgi:hypothetical protein